jgi:hypothetical protein
MGYASRTRANVRDSDATLWLGDWNSPGGKATLGACRELERPVLIVVRGETKPSDVCDWIQTHGVRVLNCAGNRESKSPGLGARVEAFLVRVFRRLGHVAG